MPLLNLGNRRAQGAGNDGEIGKLDYRIGNANVGQGVFLTGTTAILPVEANDVQYDAFETITVSTAAVLLSNAKATNHQYALIMVENVAVRFRMDGLAPTATVGHLLNANDVLVVDDASNVNNIAFISATGGSSTLQVSYGNRAVA